MAVIQVALSLLLALGALAEDKPEQKVTLKVANTTEHEKVEHWYVNVAGANDRAKCMENQLTNMGLKPRRFQAMRVLTPDCTAGGERKAFMTDYNEQTKQLQQGADTRFHIISNWCSHKQLMSKFYNSSSKAEFMLMLEDDAVLDDEKYKYRIDQFINEYDGEFSKNWQMVQLDFYGSSCKAHAVGHVGGKTVFKPRHLFKQAPGMKKPLKGSQECAQYFGGQGLLVRRSEIPSIIENMEHNPTVPLDWLPAQLDRGLAWKTGIIHNSRSYKTTKGFTKACGKDTHFASDIAKGNKGSSPYQPFMPGNLALGKTKSMLRQVVKASDDAKKARKHSQGTGKLW